MARYEFVEGSSSKFWEIELEGASFTTRWGRIGTAGQTTTKTFASAADAKKEHDKLVAEKTKKGYARVDAPKPAAKSPPPAKAKKKTAAGLRSDLSVYNEAGAFLVTNASMIGKALSPDDPKWSKAIAAGDLFPVQLVQDDSFIIRLVVGELAPEEEAEWVGRLRWKLRVLDGKLVVAAGFELVMEEVEGGRDYLRELDALREVDVPPGEYRAELLAFVNGVNGHHLVDRASEEPEKIGAYFRRTRPKEKFPPWLREWCRSYPDYDPGHEKEWVRGSERESKSERVDFLLWLTPLDASDELALPEQEEGCFPLDAWEARKPEKCPLGIVAKDPVKNPPRPAAPPPPVVTVDVMSRVKDRALAKVKGGPVDHPVGKLVQVYRLAFLATDAADPEIRIELPPKAKLDLDLSKSREATITTEGGALRIGIISGGGAKWAQTTAVDRLAGHLAKLPDGSVLELLTAHAPDPAQHRDLGVTRWRGEVRGGTWKIAETYPALDAKTLREALDLSIAVDGGQKIPLRDAAEGEKALELSKEDASLFRRNPIVLKEGSIGLTKKDDMILHWVAGYVFRTRYADLWPCWVAPPETEADKLLREKAEAATRKLQENIAKRLEEKAVKDAATRELVLDGKIGKFHRADLKKERALEAETVESCDKQMKALGYEPVGDVVCSRFSDVIARGYARAGSDAWAALLSGVLQSSFDFFTHWPTAGLTTTLNDGPSRDDEKKGVFITHHKVTFYELDALVPKHEKRVKTLSKKHGTPIAVDATLRGFAEAIDRGVARQLGIS